MFLSLLPTKNAKMDAKHSILGNKKDITRNVYNECFIVSQEPQGKKRKKLLHMEKFHRYQNIETHEKNS